MMSADYFNLPLFFCMLVMFYGV